MSKIYPTDADETGVAVLHARPVCDNTLCPQDAPGSTETAPAPEPTPVDGPAVEAAQGPADVSPDATRREEATLTTAQQRKRTPEEQGKFLYRMLRSAARRAVAEDPERGLAMLLKVQALLDELVDDVGVDLILDLDAADTEAGRRPSGGARVAAGLSDSTGEYWSRDRVWKRWGSKSLAYAKRFGTGRVAS